MKLEQDTGQGQGSWIDEEIMIHLSYARLTLSEQRTGASEGVCQCKLRHYKVHDCWV